MNREARDYSGIAVAGPVSCDYMRSSRHDVPWFVGRAIAALIKGAGIAKSDIDGFSMASYRLAPDNAASLSQYFGLSPRVLFDPDAEWTVDARQFRSMGRATPFDGVAVRGQVRLTVCGGRVTHDAMRHEVFA